jgi:hypothetical protein
VSLLKKSYACLTDNPPEVVGRILLGLGVNPLNDFHQVPWKTFAQFRRLATFRQAKAEGRRFIVNYIMADKPTLTQEEFWAIVGTVLRKLEKVINPNNVERLIERLRAAEQQWLPPQIHRSQLHDLLVKNSFFLGEELLALIFV